MTFLTESLTAWSPRYARREFRARWRGEADGLFAQGGGEAAEGTAAARGRGLAFQAAHGGQADPGLAGKLFQGQPLPVT
jgi:hypothetical protein